jgi:hypothetical protein
LDLIKGKIHNQKPIIITLSNGSNGERLEGYEASLYCNNTKFCYSVGCRSFSSKEAEDLLKQLYSFDEYLSRSKDEDLVIGNYKNHLLNYLKYFRQDQFFFIDYNQLHLNTGDILQRLVKFLNLTIDWNLKTLPNLNRSKPNESFSQMNCHIKNELGDYFKKKNEGLFDLINGPNRSIYQPYFEPFSETSLECY